MRLKREGSMKVRAHAVRLLIAPAMLIALLPACSSDEGDGTSPSASSSFVDSGGSVAVTLQEFAVGTVPPDAPAGTVTFNITNKGPDDEHEFVVVRTDLDPTALPTKANGAVDEEGEGIEIVDEVEAIPPGDSGTLEVDLEAGAYVLMCNIYDKAEKESHYQKGMRTGFTVA
jgi:uncharacterized cupredoxin-like copper-binding protein